MHHKRPENAAGATTGHPGLTPLCRPLTGREQLPGLGPCPPAAARCPAGGRPRPLPVTLTVPQSAAKAGAQVSLQDGRQEPPGPSRDLELRPPPRGQGSVPGPRGRGVYPAPARSGSRAVPVQLPGHGASQDQQSQPWEIPVNIAGWAASPPAPGSASCWAGGVLPQPPLRLENLLKRKQVAERNPSA